MNTLTNPEGHFNIYTRDHDSVVTGFGKHDRVVAFHPNGEGLYCRVDHKWRLGCPTDEQVLAVARKHQGIKGRWKIVSTEPFGDSTEFRFIRA